MARLSVCFMIFCAMSVGVPAQVSAAPGPVPVVLTMDLYHPPCDPDDHWDLLTLYALAEAGKINPLGIVLDYPLPEDETGQRPNGAGDPGVITLAQMRRITGREIPWAVGSGRPYAAVAADIERGSPAPEGAALLLDILRRSEEPVTIVITGSCRDVAIAARIDPDLFARRCRTLYLNAGVAFHEGEEAGTEWNVDLDPPAWQAIWELPCPIRWLPCFGRPGEFRVSQYGSWWNFRQGDILPMLPAEFRNILLFALQKGNGSRWLTAVIEPPDPKALRIQSESLRNMWCTAGFFDMAGWTVLRDGKLADPQASGDRLYRFAPIEVAVTESGGRKWKPAAGQKSNRYILEILDTDRYCAGMTSALRELLEKSLRVRRVESD